MHRTKVLFINSAADPKMKILWVSLLIFVDDPKIKTKEKYQLRQIRESEDTRLQGQDQSGLEGGGRLALSHKQLQSIKEVLQSNSQDLADIVKQLNGAKKDLCAWK